MQAGLDPFTFLIVSIAGWMNQRQQQVIEYLMEENRVLREQIGDRRMRFTDNQRLPAGSESQKAQPENPGAGRDNRDARDAIGVAPKIDRHEIRWQQVQRSRASTNCGGHFGSCRPYGRGKRRVGLSADSGSIIESRPHLVPQFPTFSNAMASRVYRAKP